MLRFVGHGRDLKEAAVAPRMIGVPSPEKMVKTPVQNNVVNDLGRIRTHHSLVLHVEILS